MPLLTHLWRSKATLIGSSLLVVSLSAGPLASQSGLKDRPSDAVASQSSAELRQEAEAAIELAQALLARGDFTESVASATTAFEIASEIADIELADRALEARGDAHFYLDAWRLAAADFSHSLTLAQQLGNPTRIVVARKNLGIALRVGGQLEEALTVLEEAAEQVADLGDRELSVSVLGNLATLYERMGSPRLAILIYQRLLRAGPDPSGSDGHAPTAGDQDLHLRLGALYSASGFADSAVEHLSRARDLAQELGLDHEQAWAEAMLGVALIQAGEPDRALVVLRDSESHYRLLAMAEAQAHRLLDQALAHRDTGDLQAARQRIDLALEASQHPSVRWLALTHAAQLALEEGRPTEAVASSRQALVAIDEAIDSAESPLVANSFERDARLLIDVAAIALTEVTGAPATDPGNDADRLLEYLERILPKTERNSPGDGAQAATTSLSEQLAVLYQRLAAPDLGSQERRLLTTLVDRLELGIAVESPLPSTRGADVAHDLMSRLQDWLASRPGETVVRVHCARNRGNDRLILMAVTASDTAIVSRPVDCRALDNKVGLLNELIVGDRDREQWRALSLHLYRELLAPLGERVVESSVLHVVATGALLSVPYEALLIQADPDGFLIEKVEVGYGLSISGLLQSHPSEVADSESRSFDTEAAVPRLLTMAFGDTSSSLLGRSPLAGLFETQGYRLSELESVAREVEELRRFAGPGSVLRSDHAASEGWFKRADLSAFSVLHFATHGLASAARPERSALLLAPDSDPIEDGFLQAREIAQLKIPAALVVLSACQTAPGAEARTSSFRGLAQAFRLAGTSSVVASLWPIDDRRSAAFMRDFYQRLASGLAVRPALRATKLSWIEESRSGDSGRSSSRTEWEPRHWAPFVVLGNGEAAAPLPERSQFSQRIRTPPATSTLFFLAALATAVLAWKRHSAGTQTR